MKICSNAEWTCSNWKSNSAIEKLMLKKLAAVPRELAAIKTKSTTSKTVIISQMIYMSKLKRIADSFIKLSNFPPHPSFSLSSSTLDSLEVTAYLCVKKMKWKVIWRVYKF